MKVTSWTHEDLYDKQASFFKDDLPFIERRIELLREHFIKIVYHTKEPTEQEAYSKFQQKQNAINKAIEFWSELRDDIKDSFILNYV